MFRLVFTSVLILHGLLHMIGFSHEWNIGAHTPGKLIDLSGQSSRTTGILWLLAGILFVSAAVCYLLRREWYWIPAAGALLISQALIILYWGDAKYGTLINAVFLIAVIHSAAVHHFNTITRREINSLIEQSGTSRILVTEAKIGALPENVKRWLRQSGVVGKEAPTVVKVIQKGTLRTKPDGTWMPFQATQYFSVDPPAFVWSATIKAAPLIEIAGRDKFMEGHGNMLIKPLYLFKAANSSGAEVDQGTLIRYLAEMAWFPQAALSPYITWHSTNNSEAIATITFGGVTASGIYYFDEEGRITGFEAQRYGDFGGSYRKETWSVKTRDYKSFNGITIGNVSEVTWRLAEGDFHWLNMEILNVIPEN